MKNKLALICLSILLTSCTWISPPDMAMSRVSLGNPLGLTEDKALYSKYDSRRVPTDNFKLMQKQRNMQQQVETDSVASNVFDPHYISPSTREDGSVYYPERPKLNIHKYPRNEMDIDLYEEEEKTGVIDFFANVFSFTGVKPLTDAEDPTRQTSYYDGNDDYDDDDYDHVRHKRKNKKSHKYGKDKPVKKPMKRAPKKIHPLLQKPAPATPSKPLMQEQPAPVAAPAPLTEPASQAPASSAAPTLAPPPAPTEMKPTPSSYHPKKNKVMVYVPNDNGLDEVSEEIRDLEPKANYQELMQNVDYDGKSELITPDLVK